MFLVRGTRSVIFKSSTPIPQLIKTLGGDRQLGYGKRDLIYTVHEVVLTTGGR